MGKESKPTGRNTKLTPEIQEKIVKAVRAGNYIETAAAFAGISKQTLYNWLKKGARGEGEEYVAFSEAVEQALAESEMRDLAIIERASEMGAWQAAAWRLERRFPRRWGRQDYTDIVMKEQLAEKKTTKKRTVLLDLGRATERDQS